jgi:hypothetical protein
MIACKTQRGKKKEDRRRIGPIWLLCYRVPEPVAVAVAGSRVAVAGHRDLVLSYDRDRCTATDVLT